MQTLNRERAKETKAEVTELLLPAQRLLQAIHWLAGGLQDALPAPHPNFPGSSLRADGADAKELAVTPPGHPGPAVVPGCGGLHLLSVENSQNDSGSLRRHSGGVCDLEELMELMQHLQLLLCRLLPLGPMELSLLLSPADCDELPWRTDKIVCLCVLA